ncbi:MAG: hypothetical protein ABFS17_09420, partial [Chloroflexota bacterium]
MTSTCILTDSTAQFPIPAFEGRKLVNIVGLHFIDPQTNQSIGNGLRAHDLSASVNGESVTRLAHPHVSEFEAQYLQLGKIYQEIVVITHTADLGETY